MNKKTFRQLYINKRNSIPHKEIENKSKIIADKVINSTFYKNAAEIFSYVNIGSEVITKNFIEYSLKDGKKIAVPVMGKEKGQMFFIEIKSINDLVKKKYGILEPEYDERKILKCSKETLVIVPLIAFNREKYRIGYGGGYYDRFIENNAALGFVGIAMDFQLAENIPLEIHDMPLDAVITDINIY